MLRDRPPLVAGSPAAERAAEMLSAPTALLQLSHRESRTVVCYMQPHRIVEGTQLIREGDKPDTGILRLVRAGEVTIEN